VVIPGVVTESGFESGVGGVTFSQERIIKRMIKIIVFMNCIVVLFFIFHQPGKIFQLIYPHFFKNCGQRQDNSKKIMIFFINKDKGRFYA
jgi:hypothetical protein